MLPRNRAERSNYRETSRHEDVLAFLEELLGSTAPRVGAFRLRDLGTSEEGRRLPLVLVAEPAFDVAAARAGRDPRLRIFVNANIHAGEVEGKEAVLQILREFAEGRHDAWLREAVFFFVPIFNADGNERIDVRHRVAQNGPACGVGVRPNAQGLDLNRDFVKVESPEVRALLAAWNELDPHLLFDLHTTNGSHHGYHLTYSPSLSTNVNPELDAWAREELLGPVRSRLAAAEPAFRVFDYGNFVGGDPDRGWSTYDHRPRFGTNYYGLRNRVAVLSEAYSYLDFATRIEVTRAFVLATIERAIAQADVLRRLCRAADEAWSAGPRRFGYDSEPGPARSLDVLIGSVEERELPEIGTRLVAKDEHEVRNIPVRDRFVSKSWLELPEAWVLVDPPAEVLDRLRWHGVEVEALARNVSAAAVEVFQIEALERRERAFQQHHLVRVRGRAVRVERTIPAGSYLVRAEQRLGRVAAQLLDPVSEDSLTTWNFFDSRLPDPGSASGAEHPVLRVPSLESLQR